MPKIHFTNQDIKLSDNEVKSIQQEILKGYENSDRAEKFTVNVNLHKGSPREGGNTRYFCEKDPNPHANQRNGQNKEKNTNMRKKSSKRTNSNARPAAKKKNLSDPELSVAEFLLRAFDKVMGSENAEETERDGEKKGDREKNSADMGSKNSEKTKGNDAHAKDGEEKRENENKTADMDSENSEKTIGDDGHAKDGEEKRENENKTAGMGSENSEKSEADDGHAKDSEEKGGSENKAAANENRNVRKEKRRIPRKRGESGQKKRKKVAEGSRPVKSRSEEPGTGMRKGKQKGDTRELRSSATSDQERESSREEEARRDAGQENTVIGPKHTPPELPTPSSCEEFNEQGDKKRRKGDEKYLECIRKLESTAAGGHQREGLHEQQKQEQERPQQQEQAQLQLQQEHPQPQQQQEQQQLQHKHEPQQQLEQEGQGHEQLQMQKQEQRQQQQQQRQQQEQGQQEQQQQQQQQQQHQQQQQQEQQAKQQQQQQQQHQQQQQQQQEQQEKQQQQQQQQEQQQQQHNEVRETNGSTTAPGINVESTDNDDFHSPEVNSPQDSSKGLSEQSTDNLTDKSVTDSPTERKGKDEDSTGRGSVVAESANARESPEEMESKPKVNFSNLVEQKSSIEAAIIGSGAEDLPNNRVTPASGTVQCDNSLPEVDPSDVGNFGGKTENHQESDFYTTEAGSSVFEARILGVMTDGSVQELNDERCQHIKGTEALILRNEKFSAWVSTEMKKVK